MCHRQRVKHWERGEKVRATHKIIIIDRRDMPCRADCLLLVTGGFQREYTADDYIIYR